MRPEKDKRCIIPTPKKTDPYYNRMIDLYKDKIQQLQSELDKHRWIPISERLPEGKKTILVYQNKQLRIWFYDNKYHRATIKKECTHWKPIVLPSKP